MSEKIKLSTEFNVGPAKVYNAWLDSEAHGSFTGDVAEIDPQVGGKFKAWGGYIWGETLELEPTHRILQSWRTTDFSESAPDSLLEVLIDPLDEGCRITLVHTNIPDGQADGYEEGWRDYYFTPMKEFFENNE
jgi:activator of HSP90 ATPase